MVPTQYPHLCPLRPHGLCLCTLHPRSPSGVLVYRQLSFPLLSFVRADSPFPTHRFKPHVLSASQLEKWMESLLSWYSVPEAGRKPL
jgi:hypothetical protein